jgi:ABC-type sugar transport system substrate-binding protein
LRLGFLAPPGDPALWRPLENAAREAARAARIDLVWRSPPVGAADPAAWQVESAEALGTDGIAGLVLWPASPRVLAQVTREPEFRPAAVAALFTPPPDEDPSPTSLHLGPDEVAWGRRAAQEVVHWLGGQGVVLVLNESPGEVATRSREAGAASVWKRNPGLQAKPFGDERSGSPPSPALLTAVAGAPAVLAWGDGRSHLALDAVRAAGQTDRVLVCTAVSPALLQGLEEGWVDALVIPDLPRLGATAVRRVADRLRGLPTPVWTDTGTLLITRENRHRPEVLLLLGER